MFSNPYAIGGRQAIKAVDQAFKQGPVECAVTILEATLSIADKKYSNKKQSESRVKKTSREFSEKSLAELSKEVRQNLIRALGFVRKEDLKEARAIMRKQRPLITLLKRRNSKIAKLSDNLDSAKTIITRLDEEKAKLKGEKATFKLKRRQIQKTTLERLKKLRDKNKDSQGGDVFLNEVLQDVRAAVKEKKSKDAQAILSRAMNLYRDHELRSRGQGAVTSVVSKMIEEQEKSRETMPDLKNPHVRKNLMRAKQLVDRSIKAERRLKLRRDALKSSVKDKKTRLTRKNCADIDQRLNDVIIRLEGFERKLGKRELKGNAAKVTQALVDRFLQAISSGEWDTALRLITRAQKIDSDRRNKQKWQEKAGVAKEDQVTSVDIAEHILTYISPEGETILHAIARAGVPNQVALEEDLTEQERQNLAYRKQVVQIALSKVKELARIQTLPKKRAKTDKRVHTLDVSKEARDLKDRDVMHEGKFPEERWPLYLAYVHFVPELESHFREHTPEDLRDALGLSAADIRAISEFEEKRKRVEDILESERIFREKVPTAEELVFEALLIEFGLHNLDSFETFARENGLSPIFQRELLKRLVKQRQDGPNV